MDIVTILIALLVVALVIYVIGLIPLPQPFKVIAYCILAIILILWLARNAGVIAL